MIEDIQVIRIKSDYSMTVDTVENGITSTKVISARELEKTLLKSVISTDTKSGILPTKCIAWGKSRNGTSTDYILRHDEDFADIQYMETKYPQFPIPRFVFGFKLNCDNKVTDVKLGVTAKGVLTENTEMYHYPFSNVSGFNMCTGLNKLPTYKRISSLNNLPYFILSLPNNDDHYNPNNNKLGLNHRELLEHLKDKSTEYYYTKILVKSQRKLKDFCEAKQEQPERRALPDGRVA